MHLINESFNENTKCFFLTFCYWAESKGQSSTRFGSEWQYGFIIPHAADLKGVADSYPVGWTLSWQSMGTSKRNWEACNCFHYLGLHLSYIDLGNKDVLGQAYSFSGSFEPVLWRNHHWSLNLSSGIGLVYLNRIHHPDTNPLNNFFSSHLSFLLFVAPALEYRLSDSWGARLSVNYNHISNGGQKQPNRGMNFPQVGLGLNHFLDKKDLPEYEALENRKHWFWGIESGITTRKTGNGNRREPSLSFAGHVSKVLSRVNGLAAGAELELDYSAGGHEQPISAPFLVHSFLPGRFVFSQRMAWYLSKPEDVFENFRFYQRYVLMFNLISGLDIGVSLKAHGHTASNIDFRLGWRFDQ